MSELRLNLITREWVVIASERARRPEEFRQWREKRYLPERLESCPFCPGNEAKTPSEILRLSTDSEWKIRVIPNKLAVFTEAGELRRDNLGLKHLVNGIGRHEVIVESPLHNALIPFLSEENVSDILRVYRERFIALYNDPRVEYVVVFKNHGEASGTTLQHPHSQVVGMPVTPSQVRERLEEAVRHFDNTGQCLMCASIKEELEDGRRVILKTEHFVTFIPYAALSPFHIWIFPRRHMATFADIQDNEIGDLATSLKTTISRLYHGLDNPDFNYVIRSESTEKHRSKCSHWYLSIVPRLVQPSGFALGSGMYINNSIPEEVAEFMREVKVP